MRSSSFPLVLATAAAFSFPAAAPALRRRPPRLSLLYAEEDKAFPPSNEEIDVEKEPLKKEEPFWVYLVGKPGELDADLRLLGTSRRRILEAVSLAAVIALAGDFLGMTSALLSAAPDQARTLRLDSYYGVRGLRRYVDDEERLEFLYPEPWLADRDVYLSRRQSPEEAFLSSKKKSSAPLVAFRRRRENVSVVKSEVLPGFSLRKTLGDPSTAARRLLDLSVAPPTSGKTATLLDAQETRNGYYQFDFTVQLPSGDVFHNLAVVAERGGTQLYTLTILCPEAAFTPAQELIFRQVADSFKLL
mmetsp:Transcript_16430/g.53492  ORF Transcript_16430/g.53492 Transcript_16430/m.53492 type:complete len:303 (+) Transcript_16430:24-932(+)